MYIYTSLPFSLVPRPGFSVGSYPYPFYNFLKWYGYEAIVLRCGNKIMVSLLIIVLLVLLQGNVPQCMYYYRKDKKNNSRHDV